MDDEVKQPDGEKPGGESGQAPAVEAFDAERALATIRKQRESEKALQAQVKEFQAKLAAAEEAEDKRKQAEMSEVQKAVAELDKTKKQLAEANAASEKASKRAREMELRQEFTRATKKAALEFASAQAEDDAFSLADFAGVAVEDGKVTGMEAAVKSLHKTRPYLFGVAEKSSGTPPRGGLNGARVPKSSPSPSSILTL